MISLGQCLLCGAKNRKRLAEIPQSTLYECATCGLLHLDPCLSPEAMSKAYASNESLTALHSFHEGYYDYGDLKQKSQTLADFNQALERLERLNRGKGRLLDVGAGNGFFMAAAKARGWEVEGCDTSRQNVNLAREKFGLTVHQGTLATLELEKESYDVISFWDVIEHFPNPHAPLHRAKQLLKTGGFILAGVPNQRSLLNGLALWSYRMSFGLIRKGIDQVYFLEHVAYYERATLQRLMQHSGLTLKDHFFTSTDLDKYAFSPRDRALASLVLGLGRFFRLENRLVAVFQYQS